MTVILRNILNTQLAKKFDLMTKINDRHLAKKFDLAARADDRHLAKKIVCQLAKRHNRSFEAQLQALNKRAEKCENYPSFSMLVKLWKE